MRSAIPIAACLCAALCADARQGAQPAEEWFGARSGDFDRAGRLSGRPLKMKARFVTLLPPSARKSRSARRAISFVVEAEGGRIACAIRPDTQGAALLRGMKHATPVVVRGTTDSARRLFLARDVVQGWGKRQLGEEP